MTTTIKPRRSRKALFATLSAVAVLTIAGPTLLSEWRVPGTFAESIGVASTELSPEHPTITTLKFIQDEARTALDELPGGAGIKLYIKGYGAGPCSENAAACSVAGGGTIWLTPSLGTQISEIVVHEYFHTRTNFFENVWLRFHPGVFANARVGSDWTRSLEGVADCGVQLLIPGWRENGTLPYLVDQECSDTQLRVAAAVLFDGSLDDAVRGRTQ